MNAIGIENLRCLSDTGLIQLKPLTILVGQNSAGKSTFLRALPLLRQSIESRTRGPILWHGRLVDFGNFQEAMQHGSENKEIVFRFQFMIRKSKNQFAIPGKLFLLEDLEVLLTLKLFGEPTQGITYLKECILFIAKEHEITIKFNHDGGVTTFLVNSLDLLKEHHQYCSVPTGNLIPSIEEVVTILVESKKLFSRKPVEIPLFSEVKKLVHGLTNDQKTMSRYNGGYKLFLC